MPLSTFRLLRQKEFLHFAKVSVRVSPGIGSDVIEALQLPLSIDDGQVSRSTYPRWIDAALQGCRDALDYTQQHEIGNNYLVELKSVIGVEIDTMAEDVRIAAFMAVWETLTEGSKPLELDFVEHCWQVTLL